MSAALTPRLGGDKLPIGVARGKVARKCPHIGDIGDLFRIALDHILSLLARDGDDLGHEADRDLRCAPTLEQRSFSPPF